jgi:hypothetical protein
MSRHVDSICKGRENLRLLGSMVEAWIGALFRNTDLVAGKGAAFEVCYSWIISIMHQYVNFAKVISENHNYKDQLLKYFQSQYHTPPTYEEIDEMESKRTEAIAIANKEFEDARRELRNLAPDTPDSDVLRVNRKVKEADVRLQAIRFPLHYIQEDFGIPINKIDFDKTFEKRKYPYMFFFLKTRPFTLENQYVRTGKAPVKPLISVAEARAAADAANTPVVILFENPETNDYGFLSLKWTVEIQFNNTMYNSAKQAISAELAKIFNDQENLQKIMVADTAEEVSYEF